MSHGRKIAVIGLGYVGLPVAVGFARSGAPVVGFDIDPRRIAELRAGQDRTREVEPGDVALATLTLHRDAAALADADFYIVTVPTPIQDARRPDLGALLSASQIVGRALSAATSSSMNSTVYPGATEEECVPVLEASSVGRAATSPSGYSPERINPGDKEHRFETIRKSWRDRMSEHLTSLRRSTARS